MFELTLSQPPSTNTLYSNAVINGKARRIKSQAYRVWNNIARDEYFQQMATSNRYNRLPPPPYQITIDVGKCNKGRDLDNFNKAILDFLTDNGVIKKDNLTMVHEVTIRKRFGITPDGKVTINIDYYE